jgi:hypothetical protein
MECSSDCCKGHSVTRGSHFDICQVTHDNCGALGHMALPCHMGGRTVSEAAEAIVKRMRNHGESPSDGSQIDCSPHST